MPDQRISELFIRCQQYRDRCWKFHIAKKPRAALEQATLLALASHELQKLLSDAK